MKTIIYIHGKGGNTEEAERYKQLFNGCDVTGFDYCSTTPWEAKKEFSSFFESACRDCDSVEIIANSIGAFFAMNADETASKKIEKAYFISPIVDMEKLILDMMSWANVTEERLRTEKDIRTDFGETLSYEYLCYVRKNKPKWNVPTHILYGEKDNLQTIGTISDFAKKTGASLTVMKDGEHWFHTEEQVNFLDKWIKNATRRRFGRDI